MRAVLYFTALISTALGCAVVPPSPCACSCHEKPKICNPAWNIRTFDSEQATLAIQGGWYLQLFSPLLINGATPLKTGLFSPQYPCSNLKIMFNGTTTTNPFDFKTDYIMTDISFNLATQHIELAKSLFKGAYENKKYAIFNVGTLRYYENPIVEVNPFTDESLIRHKIDDLCEREYTIACIGSNDAWNDYLIFVLINQYDNFFNVNDNHIVWVFTRAQYPTPDTYKRAFDDLIQSGISPYYLMAMDQSLDLSQIPTVTPDELYGITTETVTKSSSTISPDGTTSTSTTTVTTVSTVNFVLDDNFISPYEFDTSPLCGDIKILKNLPADVLTKIFNQKYYLKSTMPCRFYEPNVDARVGLLNSGFPASAIQIIFDNTNTRPWNYATPRYMIDRGVNVITGKTDVTRSVVMSCFDGSHPYNTISVYSEGYVSTTTIDEVSPLSLDGMICKSPGKLYTQQYILLIAGYQENGFVIFYLVNKFNNRFSPNSPINPLYVLTNDRIPSAKVIEDINQELLRIGYDARYLTNVDQTPIINDEYNFDQSFFNPDVPSSGNLPSLTSGLPSGSGPRSLGLPNPNSGCGPVSPLPGLPNPNSGCGPVSPLPGLPNPNSGCGPVSPLPGLPNPNSGCGPVSPLPGLPNPNSGCGPVTPSPGLPSYFPPNLQIRQFTSQKDTKNYQGEWFLQLYSPTYINDAHAMKTGLFSPQYPCTNLRVIIGDTTPEITDDFNTNYFLTDIAFNVLTQHIEITKSLLKAAYEGSPYVIFNVVTSKYFETPIVETSPFTDDKLLRHKIDNSLEREYTIACIGGDTNWQDYCVFVLINQYNNFYNTNDNHIVWVFSRTRNPGSETYKKAFDDLINSGVVPYYLMSMDQSVDLANIPTVTPDELNGIITDTVTKSSTTTSPDGSISTSSSTVTTVSTVDFVPNPNYVSTYEFDTSPLFGDIKIIKNLQPDIMTDIFSKNYFVKSTMPTRYYRPDVDARVGLLNSGFPASAIQVGFDNTNTIQWDYTSPRFMIDRALNVVTGKTDVTRSVVMSTFDGSHPYNTISVYSEGYTTVPFEEISPLPLDGMICKSPGKLYTQQFILSIVGYQKNDFVIFYLGNKYKNWFNPDSPFNPLFVLTNERIPSAKVLDDINQAIHLCGYDARYLSNVDQTPVIEEQYSFESSYFEIETVTSSCGGTTVTKSISSSTSSVTTVC